MNDIRLKWEKDDNADVYYVYHIINEKAVQLVRIFNSSIAETRVPNIAEKNENHFRVDYCCFNNGKEQCLRSKDIYCFRIKKISIQYDYPMPKNFKVIEGKDKNTLKWDKSASNMHYSVGKKIPGRKWIRIGITSSNYFEDTRFVNTKGISYCVRCIEPSTNEVLSGLSMVDVD